MVKRIEAAGASLLTVHGRLKEHNKQRIMHANYDMIRKIKQALSIPVIANGGISTWDDVGKALELTGCDGVMSSEAILEYPALFNGPEIVDMDLLVREYFELLEKYPHEYDDGCVRAHAFKFLF